MMTLQAQVQRAAIPQFTAQAGLSTDAGRVPLARRVARRAAKWEADEKDSSIYDFSTHAEGEEAVRLLIQNGFDATDLWLVGKGRQGAFAGFVASALAGVFNREPTGPHMLMMRGNSVEADKAHSVLVGHTNELIQECLRFR
jgi:hypothetical protein